MPATDNKGKILDDISDVVTEIFATQKGQKPTVNVVYALNGTGKTRISRYIAENNEEERVYVLMPFFRIFLLGIMKITF